MDKNSISRFINIRPSISADGLGTPVISVFLSGCDKEKMTGSYCEGCHNFELKDDGNGYNLTIDQAVNLVSKKISNQKELLGSCDLAIIGGEPLSELNREFSIELAKRIDAKTIVYTWRTVEDLKNENINISYFDRIKCGEFKLDLICDKYSLGSTNQYLINNEFKKIIEYKGE